VFLQKASNNNTKTVYGLKCDVRQFFASVNHRVLLELLRGRIGDERVIGLCEEVLNSYCIAPGKGIPLGNLTSQLFANIYLHELDWYIKNTLRSKHYLRYCDDFIILGESREQLQALIEPIGQFLNGRLGLRLHPHKVTIRSWSQGIDFLGYVLKPHCTLLRSKTRQRMIAKVNEANLTSYLGVASHADGYELGRLLMMVSSPET
jgi:retron-type reverse transcriptase